MKVMLYTIPIEKMRYPTVGDWYHQRSGGIKVEVAETGNPDYNFLIMLHELIEAYLCQKRGIKESEVTAFDLESRSGNPGAEPGSPYRREHSLAEGVERIVAEALGVDWTVYDKHLEELFDEQWPDFEEETDGRGGDG